MEFTAIVVDPQAEAVPPQWQELVARAGLAAGWDADLLTALAWCSTRPTLMVVVLSGDVPCALFHTTRLGPRRTGFTGPGGRGGPGLVMCHLPPGITTAGYAFHPDLAAAERAAAVSAFERAVTARLGWRCAGLVYRQVRAADLPVLRRRGRIVRAAVPESVIDNEWDSLDGYLRSLPARQRRNLVRTLRLVEDDPALATAVEPGLPGDEAALLLHTVQARYGTPKGVFPAVYYERLSGRAGARFFTYRERAERTLLAFGLLVDDGVTVRCQGWGTRGDERRHLYFDHFLRQIGYLIDNGRREMVMGKTMDQEKARFGARLAPLYTVAALR